MLAVPGQKPGTVHVELFDSKQTQLVTAHNNSLTQIVLNLDGSRLATASEKVTKEFSISKLRGQLIHDKGTLIRIFDTKTGEQLKELRRGADKAEIYSLAFHSTSKWICVSSDKGTVHVYGLANEEK